MKAKGTREERETVIVFNEVDELADIWTASNGTYKKLIKSGYEPAEDNERSATFKIPKKCVSLRKPKATSEKRLKALAKARSSKSGNQGRSNEIGVIVQ